MPTAFFNGNAVFKPHIEMWGYCVLSCLTAFWLKLETMAKAL